MPDCERRRRLAGVAQHVGQRLLDDPVGRGRHLGAQPGRSGRCVHHDRQAGSLHAAHQVGHVREARQLLVRIGEVGLAEGLQHPPDLCERLTAGVLHALHRGPCARGIRLQQQLGELGLNDHDGQPVRDHVVNLAGHPDPLPRGTDLSLGRRGQGKSVAQLPFVAEARSQCEDPPRVEAPAPAVGEVLGGVDPDGSQYGHHGNCECQEARPVRSVPSAGEHGDDEHVDRGGQLDVQPRCSGQQPDGDQRQQHERGAGSPEAQNQRRCGVREGEQDCRPVHEAGSGAGDPQFQLRGHEEKGRHRPVPPGKLRKARPHGHRLRALRCCRLRRSGRSQPTTWGQTVDGWRLRRARI